LDLTNIMTDKKLIDDTFTVEKERFLWHSKDKGGNGLVSALTEQACIIATLFYLKGKQEGFSDTKSYEGTVGGKL
jgi:hypothetical protein